jgi:thioredoxin 1
MLYTNLKHITTADDFKNVLESYDKAVIACGRMDAASVSVYRELESLKQNNKNILFFDFEYDNPESEVLCNMVKESDCKEIPFVIFLKQGVLCRVTFGIQSKKVFQQLIRSEFFDMAIF